MRFREVPRPRDRCLPTTSVIWLLLAITMALAEDGMGGSPWEGSFVGHSVGAGRLSSDIRDIDGFANRGNPCATQGYETGGAIDGAFAGRSFALGGISLRYEVEETVGRRSPAGQVPLGPAATRGSGISRFDFVSLLRTWNDR